MTLRNAQTPTETDTRHDVTRLDSRRPHTITWIPPGGSFVVDRHRIDRGFIHVGTGTRSLDYRIVEPALIDPELPVDWNRPNPDTGISCCPGYAELSPRARAGYLNWLADGRRNPDIDDGLLLLFLAGLERRLIEVGIDTGHCAVDEILAELRRLSRVQERPTRCPQDSHSPC
jgi:hypothetical protein